MISKKFLKKYKIIALIVILFFISLFFDLKNSKSIISDAITCISIIFAFTQSFILATYNNPKINLYMKEHNMFTGFIGDNKNFIIISLVCLGILFCLNVFYFDFSFKQFIFISSQHIAFLVILFELLMTFDYAGRYMNVYKNSYSNKVLKDIK